MKLHHLGLAVKNIEKSSEYYSMVLGLERVSEIYADPIQQVKIMFMKNPAEEISYELIEPLNMNSPIAKVLEKKQSLYHLCYEVESIEQTVHHLRTNGAVLINGPVEAVAFENRKIAFLYTPEKVLIELVEAGRARL